MPHYYVSTIYSTATIASAYTYKSLKLLLLVLARYHDAIDHSAFTPGVREKYVTQSDVGQLTCIGALSKVIQCVAEC